MAGTRAGGLRCAAANLARNPNHYSDIGRKGGKNGKGGGFASDAVGSDGLTGPERARIAGTKGGRMSRRKKTTAQAAPRTN